MSEEQFNEISGIHARLLSLDEGVREAVLRELRRTSDCFISLDAAATPPRSRPRRAGIARYSRDPRRDPRMGPPSLGPSP